MYWGYHYWGMHLFWWFFWLAIVVLLLTTGWPRARVIAPGAGGRDAALDALRMRYAAGEIDEEEYQERMAVLIGENPAAPRSPDRARDDGLPRVPEDRPAAGSGADARDIRS